MPVQNNNVQVPANVPVYWFSSGEQHPYENIAFYDGFLEDPVFRRYINNGHNPYQALLSSALSFAFKVSLFVSVVLFGFMVYSHLHDTVCIPHPGGKYGTTPNN